MKILVAEDSEKLSRSLQTGLTKSGFTVDVVHNGKHAIHCLELSEYEVIILDIMMPEMDGFGVLDWLKLSNSQSKVIILSAKDTVAERVEGLERGAHDYLVKPFAFDELLARIRVQSREYHQSKSSVSFGNFELDVDRRELCLNKTPVNLTVSEYNLVEFLALRNNRMFSKSQLRDQLYNYESDVDASVIEVMLSHIRSKVRDICPDTKLVSNKRGYGYFIKTKPA